MNETNYEFSERLLKSEQVTPSLKEKYSKEIQAMIEKKITGVQRFVWLASAIGGLAFAVLFGTLAVILPADFPWGGRAIFALGLLFGLGWAFLGIKIFRHGSINLKTDTWAAAGMAWGLPVIIVTFCMVSAPDNIVGLRMILSGLVFLVMGALFLIQYYIERSELKTREKLLEIEFHLAELAESLKPEKR